MSKYVFDLDNNADMKLLYKEFDNMSIAFDSMDFKRFIANKCLRELDNIMNNNLNNISDIDVPFNKLDEYKRSNKVEITDDYILIFNATNLDVDEMYWVSPKTKEDYPEGISVSYIIEYGTGLPGKSQEDWETNVPSKRKHKDGTWTFEKDGVLHKNISGTAGRFIYQKLLEKVQQKFADWVYEYYLEKVEV